MSQINIATAEDAWMSAEVQAQAAIAEFMAQWLFPVMQTQAALMMGAMSERELEFVDEETIKKLSEVMYG